MAVPQTGGDPTAFGPVANAQQVTTATRRRSCQRLTTATSVTEARAHLRATGEPAAVIYRGRAPVGLVTAAALCDEAGSNRSDEPVIAVMDYVTVPVAGYGDARAALRAINRVR
jgi:hypothetical protein